MSPRSARHVTLFCFLATFSCGTPSRDTEFGASDTVGQYLEAVKPLLQDLRLLEQQIEAAVPADQVESHVIVPLIEEQILPQLNRLRERARLLPATAELMPTNDKLLAYLELRIAAYHLVLEGARENRPELFASFDHRQVEADSASRVFATSLRQVQDSLH